MPPSFSIAVTGVKQVAKIIENKKKKAIVNSDNALNKFSQILAGKVTESIFRGTNAPKAIDTGAYGRSINAKKVNVAEYKISDGVQYGKYVEYGTSRMPARPHFRNTLKKEKRNITQAIQTAIRKL